MYHATLALATLSCLLSTLVTATPQINPIPIPIPGFKPLLGGTFDLNTKTQFFVTIRPDSSKPPLSGEAFVNTIGYWDFGVSYNVDDGRPYNPEFNLDRGACCSTNKCYDTPDSKGVVTELQPKPGMEQDFDNSVLIETMGKLYQVPDRWQMGELGVVVYLATIALGKHRYGDTVFGQGSIANGPSL